PDPRRDRKHYFQKRSWTRLILLKPKSPYSRRACPLEDCSKMNSGASSRKSRLLALLLGGFGLGIAALVLELAVRIFVPVSDFFCETDPVLGVKLIPNKHGRSVKPGLFDVPIEINSHGFRDREHSYDKPADIKRILILGDSYVEALQIPLDRSVTVLL